MENYLIKDAQKQIKLKSIFGSDVFQPFWKFVGRFIEIFRYAFLFAGINHVELLAQVPVYHILKIRLALQ